MFDEARKEADGGAGQGGAAHVGDDWRTIDRKMRRLAARRSALDAEEARLLVIARRMEIHRELGYGSFDEYLERALGYAPTTGRDRVRVAEALEGLPDIRRAMERGGVAFSVVREVTRVATPDTEGEWLDYVDGLTVREVEEAVRGRRRGDRPTDRPDPDLEPRILRIEVPSQTYALYRDARRHLEKQVGHTISDADFMAAASRAILGGSGKVGGGGGGGDGDAQAVALDVPPHQVALVVCDHCKRGWHDAPGRSIELSPAAIERVRCDAVELGRVNDCEEPSRRTWTIAPRRRKAVLARDRHRCTVPGCTSSSFVDVHHIKHREHGGDDRMSNLTTLCELHHSQHHARVINIGGVGGAVIVTHSDGRPYGAPPPPLKPPRASADERPPGGRRAPSRERIVGDEHVPARPSSTPARGAKAPAPPSVARQAAEALVHLGFRRDEATAAVSRAAAHVGDAAPLEALITSALREAGRARMRPSDG